MSLLAAITLGAAATTAAATPATPPKPATLQQQFDAASDAAAERKCIEAIPMFETLERNPAVKKGSIAAAAIAVRKGNCLIRDGRLEEGEASVRTGLPRLESAGEPFAIDVADGYLALGNASLLRTDFSEARRQYERSLAPRKGTDRVNSLSLLARTTAFDSGPEPLAYVDEALSLVEAQAKPSKDLLAQLRALRGRILMNRGQDAEAYAELKKALQLSGGLTNRVSLSEVSLRGDLAQAALLLNKKDDARLYLAYTGAGRISESPFARGAIMDPPECGGETGLKPEDAAVVEFGIGEDGQVAYAETVYAKGGPRAAGAFARAVKGWYWRPELLAKIPAFYRASTRVELRCSAAGGGMPSIFAPLDERFEQWARAYVPLQAEAGQVARVASFKAAFADREAKGDGPGQVAAAGLLASQMPFNDPEVVAVLDRALAAGEKAGVSAEPLNLLRIRRVGHAAGRVAKRTRVQEAYLALLQIPDFAADALTSDAALLAAAGVARRQETEEGDRLVAVAQDDRLPQHHPLRQVARLRLANQAAAAGDLARAQSYFASTGLTEQQCALIGATPRLRSSGVSSSDFPMTAAQYGFEGWVKLEYDILSEGKPSGVRAVVAYPPFIFVDAAQGMARDFRYETSYRPNGAVACNAQQTMLNFLMNKP